MLGQIHFKYCNFTQFLKMLEMLRWVVNTLIRQRIDSSTNQSQGHNCNGCRDMFVSRILGTHNWFIWLWTTWRLVIKEMLQPGRLLLTALDFWLLPWGAITLRWCPDTTRLADTLSWWYLSVRGVPYNLLCTFFVSVTWFVTCATITLFLFHKLHFHFGLTRIDVTGICFSYAHHLP